MIFRTKDVEYIRKTMDKYASWTHGFYPEEWVADDRNIALTDGEGSLNLLEYDGDGVYFAHTFYECKGKQAVKTVREAVDVVFTQFPVEVMKGLTPLEKLGARWLARQAGFKGYGAIKTSVGPCELFILTKKEYMETQR